MTVELYPRMSKRTDPSLDVKNHSGTLLCLDGLLLRVRLTLIVDHSVACKFPDIWRSLTIEVVTNVWKISRRVYFTNGRQTPNSTWLVVIQDYLFISKRIYQNERNFRKTLFLFKNDEWTHFSDQVLVQVWVQELRPEGTRLTRGRHVTYTQHHDRPPVLRLSTTVRTNRYTIGLRVDILRSIPVCYSTHLTWDHRQYRIWTLLTPRRQSDGWNLESRWWMNVLKHIQ